ncbi:hypothetical protein FJZ31_23130 [Candidatus Poribacteria bacterium]|nr:hypothetical protein [Candidatus Poribacteria bacterium]
MKADDKKTHVLEINERLLCPDDGLILGNGDLSVSVYQTVDRIIWRFGKGDVWDRRLDLSDNPAPITIEELAHGIKDEGWKCGPYGGPVEALHGTDNPERMKEVCQGTPPGEKNRPYPCPKPVGELVMQLPPDQINMKINQRLVIEEGRLDITCMWDSGLKITAFGFIPVSPNALVVHWKIENWNKSTITGNKPPVWFWLYRWADPPLDEYAARFNADFMHGAFNTYQNPKVTPLPSPSVQNIDGVYIIEQTFYKDRLFPEGFRYWMAPYAPDTSIEPVNMSPLKEARLRIMPKNEATEGWLTVDIPTSSEAGDVLEEFQRLRATLGDNPVNTMKRWQKELEQASEEFWAKSSVTIADEFFENLWYETIYLRRCAYRSGTTPPGLFLPSTVSDYSHWHGDYHTNYNFQQPFWGDYQSNHLDIGDAYFDGMEYLIQIGRKIANDYYGCRGVFIQLSGFPIHAEDDYLGIAPMGRMAYMTGWAMEQYWWRYLYTMDKDWLREKGYPFIRDCALFYTDFLKKGDDGLYHAFPSNQGEDGFTGNPKDYTDRSQVMRHICYCLRSAIKASEELGIDEDLRTQWQDRLENIAPDDGKPAPKLAGIEKRCAELNSPSLGFGRPYKPQPKEAKIEKGDYSALWLWSWYFGQTPLWLMPQLRGGTFIANRDFGEFRKLIQRWRHPNGIIWGMAMANYGHCGAWTESLGVIAPLQEMMLQSWDGALRIFPAWQSDLSASFHNFRAEGAFLVSAEKQGKEISYVLINSLAGGSLSIYNPFFSVKARIRDITNSEIIKEGEWAEGELVKIGTEKNHLYLMEQISNPYMEAGAVKKS